MTLENDGIRWRTLDNAIQYEITTLVLKICKNLLDTRRLEHLFAPRPLPAEHTFASACGKLVDNFPAPVDNFYEVWKTCG